MFNNIDKAVVYKGIGLVLTVCGSIITSLGTKEDTNKALEKIVEAKLNK